MRPPPMVGRWADGVVDEQDTLHVLYQDVLGERLLYRTWTDGTLGPVEVVDDGTRDGDRPHPVGCVGHHTAL